MQKIRTSWWKSEPSVEKLENASSLEVRVGLRVGKNSFAQWLLSYDAEKFRESPERFLAEQIGLHRAYLGVAREELREAQIDTYQMLNNAAEDEDKSEFGIWLEKLTGTARAATSFRSFRAQRLNEIKFYRGKIRQYETLEAVFSKGGEFIRNLSDGQPQSICDGVEKWGNIQSDLIYISSKQRENAQKQADLQVKRYNLHFQINPQL
jgi:hypothetical protein